MAIQIIKMPIEVVRKPMGAFSDCVIMPKRASSTLSGLTPKMSSRLSSSMPISLSMALVSSSKAERKLLMIMYILLAEVSLYEQSKT